MIFVFIDDTILFYRSVGVNEMNFLCILRGFYDIFLFH